MQQTGTTHKLDKIFVTVRAYELTEAAPRLQINGGLLISGLLVTNLSKSPIYQTSRESI
jgi:hypothetical protein